MSLDLDTFKLIVESTPLISIDLVIQDEKGKVLLGQRSNRPAKGFWFVPGGRVFKNETLDNAFARITLAELGKTFNRQNGAFLGIYEHFYEDSFLSTIGPNSSTHYIVLAYLLTLPINESITPPTEQHNHYRWWSVNDIEPNTSVHSNSRAYIQTLRQ